MGFYIRKSIKVGPLRFNLSKSGLGVSGGVKGFRVGTGPRGNYIHMGRGGVYYRQSLPGGGRGQPQGSPAPARSSPVYPSSPSGSVKMTQVESSDVSQMSDSSSAALLQEINEKKALPRFGPWGAGLTAALLALGLLLSWPGFILGLLALAGGFGSFYLFRRDELRKTVVMLYDFDPSLEQAFENFHDSMKQLSRCSGCWHISASGTVADRKYHAGASELVERASTSIRVASPAFLKTNVETVAVGVGRQTLYFFPDRILVFDEGRVGAIGYDALIVSVKQTRFIENSAPSDARVVDKTWKYVNKKGGPDRRFANNPELPICLYDELHFQSRNGLNEILQVSRTGVGQPVQQALMQLGQSVGVRV